MVGMEGEETQGLEQTPRRGGERWRPRDEDMAGQVVLGARIHMCGRGCGCGQEPRAVRARCGPGGSNSAAPVNSHHASGTWLGSAVHDPDESLS